MFNIVIIDEIQIHEENWETFDIDTCADWLPGEEDYNITAHDMPSNVAYQFTRIEDNCITTFLLKKV